MFPVALLSALLAVVTVGDGMAITVDARLAALAAAAVALLLRAPVPGRGRRQERPPPHCIRALGG
jgi:hypothetical protein